MPNLLEYIRDHIWDVKNAITVSPPVMKRPLRSERSIVNRFDDSQQARLEALSQKYARRNWTEACTALEYLESLYVLDICDRYLSPTGGRGLDIGCKNWAYLPALCAFSGNTWDGVELDAYRRYIDLTTRKAHGEYMVRQFPGCRYIAGSLCDLRDRYQTITWFLPFVTVTPLVAWGLPRRFFEPEALLRRAWDLLLPGGEMFIVNQGRSEADRQQSLFTATGLSARELGRIESCLSPFKKERFGWLVKK